MTEQKKTPAVGETAGDRNNIESNNSVLANRPVDHYGALYNPAVFDAPIHLPPSVLTPIVSRVRTDRTAVKKEDGRTCWTHEALTEKLLSEHLNGGAPRGCCPIKPGESTTMVAVLDLDSHKGETSWADMCTVALSVSTALVQSGLRPNVFRSTGGRGIHLIMLWDEPQDARAVRQLLKTILKSIGYSDGSRGGVASKKIEIFPKQDNVSPDGCGNMFILPMAGKSEPLELLASDDPMQRDSITNLAWLISDPVPLEQASTEHPDNVDPDLRLFKLMEINQATVDTVRSAMPFLPIDFAEGYDGWALTGLALASIAQGGFEDDAREMWHSFSERGSSYDYSEADDKFDGFIDSSNKLTFATILKLAQENGWVNPKNISAETRIDRSDTANVNLMYLYTKGDLRYLPERDQWITWTGSRWEVDIAKSALQAASRKVGEHYHEHAAQKRKDAEAPGLTADDRKKLGKVADSTESWATQCRNHLKMTAMQAQAKMDPRFTLALDALDRDPYLLGVQNGVVDLRTGHLHPDARDQFVTRRAAFNFNPFAKAPRWEKFIEEITATPMPVEKDAAGNIKPESVGRYIARPAYGRYVQKALGYGNTGLTSEQKMFICCGEGGNGKNIMLDALKVILPDYVAIISPALLTAVTKAVDADAPSAATATLAGHRFAIASEAKAGAKLDVETVKSHTGNKYMAARFLHGNPFTFEVTHKLWLMTNHKPRIDDMDDAMKGRIHILPFDRQWNRPGRADPNPHMPDGDKHLEAKLAAESEGILAWMVAGAVAYFKEGLEPPATVTESTKAYITDQDAFAAWLLDRCDTCEPKDGAQGSALFSDFVTWCAFNGRKQQPSSEADFTKALKKSGHAPRKISVNKYPLRLKVETMLSEPANSDGFEDIG